MAFRGPRSHMTRSGKCTPSLIVMRAPASCSRAVCPSFTITNPFHRATNQVCNFAGTGAGFRMAIVAEI